VVLRLVPAPGHQGAVRQLPGRPAADPAEQLQREGHLQPVAEQQADRLHAAVAEEAAAAVRFVPARSGYRHQHLHRDDLEPELLGLGAQGRVERRPQRQRVRRGARRPVRLRLGQRR
jgi:hypothetical protein